MIHLDDKRINFFLRQAIWGEFCNVCPSCRICAETLPGDWFEILPTIVAIQYHFSSLYFTWLLLFVLINCFVLHNNRSVHCIFQSVLRKAARQAYVGKLFLETGFNISKSRERGRRLILRYCRWKTQKWKQDFIKIKYIYAFARKLKIKEIPLLYQRM